MAFRGLRVQVGDRLTDHSNYDLRVERVAGGSFGAVAMGPDAHHQGEWRVMKMLHPALLRSERTRELFVREALTWVGLWSHPNVMVAEAVIEINGQPVIVLHHAARGNVRRIISLPQISLRSRMALAQHIAAGLAHLHTPDPEHLRPWPLVHRDLKPENILLYQQGIAAITDFGLAKAVASAVSKRIEEDEADEAELLREAHGATRTQRMLTRQGEAFGTPAYMAPEQWADAASAGPPADIFAFGIVLSEVLVGRHAFLDLERSYPVDLWRHTIANGRPRSLYSERPELTPEVEALYLACLERDPANRPGASEALAALRHAVESQGVRAWPEQVRPPTAEQEFKYWHRWANAHVHFKLYAEAKVRSARALELSPDHPTALLTQANILKATGRVDEAEAIFGHLLEVVPAENVKLRKIIWHQRGNLRQMAGNYAAADAAYNEALALAPDAAQTWYNRGVNAKRWAEAVAEMGHGEEASVVARRGLAFLAEAVRYGFDHRERLEVEQALLGFAGRDMGEGV